ncbi:MAG: sigma-70 family RNA polymerase sigma factor [Betaproteobacteria bacterium]|nr:sigma-70 family RNA polymerase sigma factor [Betaproteobacteria bacterium]
MLDNTLLHELMARSALRDQRAFAELYRHTCAKLFGVALRIVRRQDWAEEVLQESFVSIWNHAEGYSSSKSAQMTWMTAIVRNRALDWLRRPHFEVASDDYQLLLESVADEGDGPELLLSKDREGRALAECMKQLSSKQRQSIALAYTHGLSHGELSAHIKEPLGTVKTWIRRGLERLKGCLDGMR